VFAEADASYYCCTTSVAMTDDQDISTCKVLRKLTVGELFIVEEGPVEDKEAGISRVRGKAVKDDQSCWITIKGNAGTVYAEASKKYWTTVAETPMQKQFSQSGTVETVRTLSKGEAFQVLEGPKEQPFPPEIRVKGRALSDGAVGWITLKGENVKPWSPYYKCLKAVSMYNQQGMEGADVVRELATGEQLELLEGPLEDGKALRMKARAEKNGSVGWVTIKDGEGNKYLA